MTFHGSGVDSRAGESSSVSGHVGFSTNSILEERRLDARRRNTGQSFRTQSPNDFRPSKLPSYPVPSRGSSTELSNSSLITTSINVDKSSLFPPSSANAGHWEKMHKYIRKYNIQKCTAWKDEIAQVMIFAALFSGTVVGFIGFSHLMLKQNSQAELLGVLRHIATEFDVYKIGVQRGNFTSVQFKLLAPEETFKAPGFAVRLNGFLFVSLGIALSTALIGMTTLQWIREFERNPRLGPMDAAVLQYIRLEGIIFWSVPQIVSLLPVLLQTALAIFFWALCDLLLSLDQFLATSMIVYIGIVFSCFLLANTLPFFRKCHQVPFKSPQARWFAILASWCAGVVIKILLLFWPRPFLKTKADSFRDLSESLAGRSDDWLALEAWQLRHRTTVDDIPRTIVWVAKTHICKRKAVAAMYNTLEDLDTPKRMAVLHEFFAEDKPYSCVRRFIRSWKDIEVRLRSGDLPNDTMKNMINLLKDVTHSLVLNKLVEKNPQLGPDLLNVRMELFLTIINYKAQGNSTEGEDQTPDVWRIFPRKDSDVEDNDIRSLFPAPIGESDVQLIGTFRTNLRCVVFHNIFFKLVLPLACPSAILPDLLDEFKPMNFDLRKGPINDRSLGHIEDYIKDWGNTRSEQWCVPVVDDWQKNVEDGMRALKGAISAAIR